MHDQNNLWPSFLWSFEYSMFMLSMNSMWSIKVQRIDVRNVTIIILLTKTQLKVLILFCLWKFLVCMVLQTNKTIITRHWFWQPWDCFKGSVTWRFRLAHDHCRDNFSLVCQMPIRAKLQKNGTMIIVSKIYLLIYMCLSIT